MIILRFNEFVSEKEQNNENHCDVGPRSFIENRESINEIRLYKAGFACPTISSQRLTIKLTRITRPNRYNRPGNLLKSNETVSVGVCTNNLSCQFTKLNTSIFQ